jgi:hypothetical protein
LMIRFPRLLRFLKYMAIVVAAFALGLAGWWFGPAKQGAAVVDAVLGGVEKHLAVDVQVGVVSASFWRNFPSVGVLLESVEIEDALRPGSSFLDVEKMEVRFNLWDILQANYAVDRVLIRGGRVDLVSGENGNNWHFWKDGGSDGTAFDLALPDVRLEDVTVTGNFKGATATTTRFSTLVDLASVQLNYSAGSWKIGGHLRGQALELHQAERSYIDFSTLVAGFEMDWIGSTKTAEVRFDAKANDVEVAGDLRYVRGDFSLNLRGDQTDLEAVRTALPAFIQAPLEDLSWSGRCDFDVAIGAAASALAGNESAWLVKLQPHGVSLATSGLAVDNLMGLLRLTPAGEHIRLDFANIKATVAGGALTGEGHWTGSSHWGKLVAATSWSGKTSNLASSINASLSSGGPGSSHLTALDLLDGHISWSGDLEGPTSASATLDDWTIQGVLEATQLQLSHALAPVQSIESATVKIASTGYTVELLAHTAGGVFTAHALAPPNLSRFTVKLSADELNLAALEATLKPRDTSWTMSSTNTRSPSPALPAIHFEATVLNAHHGELSVDHAQLKGQLSPSGALEIESFQVNTCGGIILGTAQWLAPQWSVQAQASSLDLHELLASTKGLGQDVVRAENLYGVAALNGSATWDPTRPEGAALAADFTMTVHNGGLKNFAMLTRIPAAIRDQPGMRALADADDLQRRLEHVRFGELSYRFEVADGAISFPPAHILSDALDIGIGGSYGFNGSLAYTVDFALRDLRDQRSEFGDVEDDGLGHRFFLGIGGTVDEPEFWYDRSAHNAFRKARRHRAVPGIFAPASGAQPKPLAPSTTTAAPLSPSITNALLAPIKGVIIDDDEDDF